MKLFRKKIKPVWFRGNYSDWAEAQASAKGYSAPNILNKTLASILKVKSGEACYERDSVLFGKPDYSFPFVSAILHMAMLSRGEFTILDFGGSLGSSYFQVRPLLPKDMKVKWVVVEQEHYVNAGKEYLESNELVFCKTAKEACSKYKPDFLLLLSVIQYVQSPYSLLAELLSYSFQGVLIDRTSFIKESHPERIVVQDVGPQIYEASYPMHFLHEEALLKYFEEDFSLVFDFKSDDFSNIKKTYYKGHYFLDKKIHERAI